MATAESLMTAEEFGKIPDDGRRTELVRGKIVELPPTNFLHGLICSAIAFSLQIWAREHKLGRVVTNDSGIVTRRDPDTLRGADVAYYSFDRLPKDSIPEQYPNVAPELVVEVRSPTDCWRDIHGKVAEHLDLGVLVVCVIDPKPQTARLYYPDQADRTLGPDDELTFPDCLPGFGVQMRSFFE